LKPKNTDDLKQELMKSPNLHEFLTDNRDHFSSESAPEMLNRLFLRKKVSKAILAKQSSMSEVYLHQIFAGRRNPSRNRLICLCYGLNASLEETQELLKRCGLAQLFPKIRRDAIIIYGLMHEVSLTEINDKLFEEKEETLF